MLTPSTLFLLDEVRSTSWGRREHENPTLYLRESAMPTRDDLIREYRMRAGNFPGLVVVYAIIVGTMATTAAVIL
ncbi:hypothetical protein SAMN04488094_109138 [Tropicimonas isoalkanivorans]|uniref:Uncharacterized protein n=1 Tax=Tropicimonas isoalkanivorans TaxID=441112 RepID=A0A1I1M385_9RHOB|nr:hypothetical protein SAMN04488094_109138 [Tropicimonas isoalkanivorans]